MRVKHEIIKTYGLIGYIGLFFISVVLTIVQWLFSMLVILPFLEEKTELGPMLYGYLVTTFIIWFIILYIDGKDGDLTIYKAKHKITR